MANGTIAFDTLETTGNISGKTGVTATSTDADYLVQKCSARGKFPGDGASITESFNVSSLTDTNTGRQTPNFSSNFNTVNYSIGHSLYNNISEPYVGSQTTSSFLHYMYGDNNAYTDTQNCITLHGDMA